MCDPSIGEVEHKETTLLSGDERVIERDVPRSEIELSFVHRYLGESGREYVNHWSVAHSPNDHWNRRADAGTAFFGQIEAYAEADEAAAFDAMRMAVLSPNWSTQGWGEESGFAWQFASAAIVGLRAIRAGWERYQPPK